mmetsp:Transcript_21806/g.44800  ORF Transcript_21806/g.44800 Transcript_21806/m.44800 type:complete len:213 (+) Transcript_21806:871-1509(+)
MGGCCCCYLPCCFSTCHHPLLFYRPRRQRRRGAAASSATAPRVNQPDCIAFRSSSSTSSSSSVWFGLVVAGVKDVEPQPLVLRETKLGSGPFPQRHLARKLLLPPPPPTLSVGLQREVQRCMGRRFRAAAKGQARLGRARLGCNLGEPGGRSSTRAQELGRRLNEHHKRRQCGGSSRCLSLLLGSRKDRERRRTKPRRVVRRLRVVSRQASS